MKDRLSSRRVLRPVFAALAFVLVAGSAVAQLRMPAPAGKPAQGGDPALRLPGASASPDTAPAGAAPAPASSGPGASAPAPSAAPANREIDRVVAVVNSDVITLRELERRAEIVANQLRRQGVELPPRDVLLRQLLERMIIDRAQAQMARDFGLRVDGQQLERAVAGFAQENGLTVAQLRQRIEGSGESYDQFREELRQEILLTRLREREVDSKVQVSEADVDAFIAAQAVQPSVAAEYLVAQILLRIPEGATPEQIERQRLRGEEIRKQLGEGANFARLAAAFSDAPDALSGGLLGWRTADRLPELFAQAVQPMRKSEVSGLLRSPAGFHLLMLVDRRDGGAGKVLQGAPVTQTRARHILIRPNEMVSEAEAFRRLGEIRQRVEAGTADFAEMARQYSSDGSAGRGGDLGWVYPGDTVPEFERAMQALAPGAISEPIRTTFGVHLIQVLERRTDEASPERVRQQAREALRARRIEERYQDWLRQLRDSTYVEYKLDGN